MTGRRLTAVLRSGVKGAWHVFVYELKFLVFKFAILVHEKRVSNVAFANFFVEKSRI